MHDRSARAAVLASGFICSSRLLLAATLSVAGGGRRWTGGYHERSTMDFVPTNLLTLGREVAAVEGMMRELPFHFTLDSPSSPAFSPMLGSTT